MKNQNSLTYKDAGVDIDAGDALVENIKPLARSTRRAGADSNLGGFGGLFDLKAAGFNDPILVAATDGVGTKLRVALEAGVHDTVGIDLVAMCVNDLIVQGAEPLFFLDYMATGHLEVDQMTAVVAGIAEGCNQAGCALIGGETAEMPGMYAGNDYDLAGFSVGAAERGTMLDGSNVQEGNILLGLASSGFHSNGYSLVRKLVEHANLDYNENAPFEEDCTLGEALLAPTKIYVKSCLAAIKHGGVNALSHITGGGFLENIPRVLPKNLKAVVDSTAWSLPPVFEWAQKAGNISARELARTFNCGIGMVLAVDASKSPEIKDILEQHGETVFEIGHVMTSQDGVVCEVTGDSDTWGELCSWSAVKKNDD